MRNHLSNRILAGICLSIILFAPATFAAETQGATQNTKEPVEVNADQLEVLQQENKAIFTGNVVAVQGVIRLRSDKMIVHYKQKSGDAPKPAGSDVAAGGISKIEVEGNVLMTQPQETASGTRGIYDVDKKEIRLIDNVILTRDQNVLKGDSLVYNLASGRSVLTSGNSAVSDGAQAPKGNRVRALFVPEKQNGKGAAKP